MQVITDFCEKYSYTGDFIVVGMTFLFLTLMRISYIKKDRSYYLFEIIVFQLWIATCLRLLFYFYLNQIIDGNSHIPIIMVRLFYYVFYFVVFTTMMCFLVYIVKPLHIEKHTAIGLLALSSIFYIEAVGYEIYELISGEGFNIIYINNKTMVYSNRLPYIFLSQILIIMFLGIIVFYRHRIYKQISLGIFLSCLISVIYMFTQYFRGTDSYTLAAFLFPLFSFFYLMHSNPYDIHTGTIDMKAFYGYVEEHKKKNNRFVIVEIYLPLYEKINKDYPDNFRKTIRGLFSEQFKSMIMFQTSPGYLVITADLNKNNAEEDYTERINNFYETIMKYMEENGVVYKVLSYTSPIDHKYTAEDYIGLFRFIGSKIVEKSCYYIDESDEKEYEMHKIILSELEDIATKADLNDERINVYCQPVYDVNSDKYSTAEALIRLGGVNDHVITPDKFIFMAEKYGYIHHLGYVMLNQVCKSIKKFLAQGYEIERISVNFTVSDFKNNNFCENILKIIKDNGISPSHIAIEVTETQDETDFNVLKAKMKELKKYGIKFYLDDFGTGYSNYDRILELPFDIIKFDRSLVMACSLNNKSEIMVKKMSEMFNNFNLSILFEGVETSKDIKKCKDMNGDYLQGFYYSKPVPIEELTNFLSKQAS